MTFATYAFIVKRYWNRELKSQDDEGETYACWRDGNLFSRRGIVLGQNVASQGNDASHLLT